MKNKTFIRNSLAALATVLLSSCARFGTVEHGSATKPAPPAPEKTITLAQNGAAEYAIVTAAEPTLAEQTAARELAECLGKVTGAEFKTVTEAAAEKPSKAIHLGWTAFAAGQGLDGAKLGPEEWVVKTFGDALVITGGRPRGTLYGVYDFLENQVGVHWLDRGAEVAPKRPTLTVGPLDRRAKPAFRMRNNYPTRLDEGEMRFRVRNRQNYHGANVGDLPTRFFDSYGGREFIGGPYHCHNFSLYVPVGKYAAEHPEYYAQDKHGKRLAPLGHLSDNLCDNRQRVLGTAINALLMNPTDTTIQSLLTAYPQMPTLGKIACLQAFARHNERQALPIACSATLDADPNLKATGIAVLGYLNDARAVPRLVALMSDKTEKAYAEAASASMTQLRGTEINAAVMALLTDTNVAIRATAVKCLSLRRATEATPALFALRTSEIDRLVRAEIPRALGVVASPDDLQQLLACVLEAKTEGERDAYFLAYGAAGRRLSEPAMRSELLLKHIDSATREVKILLLRGLGQTGGEQAAQKVIAYLAGDDLEFKDAAVRALASWADDSVVQSLVPVIKGAVAGLAPKHKVIALQGYLRMILLDSKVRGDAASMEMIRFAWSAATRPEEKNTIVSILHELRCTDSFEILSQAVKDPTTAKLATEVAVKLGKFGVRRKTDQNLKATMRWLRDTSANADAKRTAGTILKNYFNE